jgi:hypothetical protein
MMLALLIAVATFLIFEPKKKELTHYASLTNIPAGWQFLKDEKVGIQVVAPPVLEYKGCKQPVKLGLLNGQLSLGALMTPCTAIMNVNKYSDDYADVFGGYVFNVIPNVNSAKDVQTVFEKIGDCKINFTNWKKGIFEITDGRPPVNQWAPRSCGSYTDNPNIIHSFYNARTRTFVIWTQPPQTFSTGSGQYADAGVKIQPY